MRENATTRRFRPLPTGQGVCRACLHRGPARPGLNGHPNRMHRHHRPDGTLCRERESLRWIEATGLPTWDELTDRDRGAAIMHCWARHTQGVIHAREHAPATFWDDELLTALTPYEACRYTAELCGSYAEITDRLGEAERERLYQAALDAASNPSPSVTVRKATDG